MTTYIWKAANILVNGEQIVKPNDVFEADEKSPQVADWLAAGLCEETEKTTAKRTAAKE